MGSKEDQIIKALEEYVALPKAQAMANKVMLILEGEVLPEGIEKRTEFVTKDGGCFLSIKDAQGHLRGLEFRNTADKICREYEKDIDIDEVSVHEFVHLYSRDLYLALDKLYGEEKSTAKEG